MFINGVTNLPVGTKLGIDISSTENGYSAQSYNLFVKSDGTFQSEGFTNRDKSLVGNYNVEVISYINNFWQNKDILNKLLSYKKYIGERVFPTLPGDKETIFLGR